MIKIKNRSFKASFATAVLLGSIVTFSPGHAYAATHEDILVEEKNTPKQESVSEQPLIYDDNQEIYNENGEYVGKIVVEEMPVMMPFSSLYNYYSELSNKNYNVHFIGVSANVGFGVTVNNKQIVNAYDPWANGVIYDITLGSLSYTSIQAKLPGRVSVGIKDFGFNTTFTLKASIYGNYLHTELVAP